MTSIKRLWLIVSLVFIAGLIVALMSPNRGIVDSVDKQAEQKQKSDIYHPARTAITNARKYFSESFQPQSEIQAQTQQAHQSLSDAIGLLYEGQGLDPTAREEITQLRNDLKHLRDTDYITAISAEELRSKYQEILDRFESLIEKY